MYPGKIAEAKKQGDPCKVAPEAAPDVRRQRSDSGDLIPRDDSKTAAVDPERDETLNILSDLVQLTQRSQDRQHRALIRQGNLAQIERTRRFFCCSRDPRNRRIKPSTAARALWYIRRP